jgi:hypothetical protein
VLHGASYGYLPNFLFDFQPVNPYNKLSYTYRTRVRQAAGRQYPVRQPGSDCGTTGAVDQQLYRLIMLTQEWSQIWHNVQLDVELLQASYVQHAYPRHFHEYYVICVIEQGFQSFTHKNTKHFTPPGGIILINPGAVQ